LHDAQRKLTARRWLTRAWICCKLEFNNRHRNVWGDSYTELFFLDEVTAFAAGHRPCFECRRKDAERFAVLFSGKKNRAATATMDRLLHAERLKGKAKRTHRRILDTLPDGAMIASNGEPFAVWGQAIIVLDACRIHRLEAALARYRGRCTYAAVDYCRASGGLHADLASERTLISRRLDR